MNYKRLGNLGYIADPQNWEELKQAIHSTDKPITMFNPAKEKYAKGKEILAMFG